MFGGITIAMLMTLQKARKITDNYQTKIDRLAEVFNELDLQYPVPATHELAADRFAAFLTARHAVADLIDTRSGTDRGALTVPGTRIEMLETLREELVLAKMTRVEYQNITHRLWMLLARGAEPGAPGPMQELNQALRAALQTGRERDRIVLPDAAPTMSDAERELIYKSGSKIQESMSGDRIMRVLSSLPNG